MTSMRRSAYAAGASLLALAVGLSTTRAEAQPTPPAPKPAGKGVEEVVVTARKRSERLQKVPIAITVLGGAQIAQNKIVSIVNLGEVTPSLTFLQALYSPFNTVIGIRGQRGADTVLSQSPAVGTYIDGVYQPVTVGLGVGALEDVQQIEILKGPQGTLYGRNTTGGAVRVTSKLPDEESFSGSLRVGFGNYNSNEDVGVLNIPIVKDKAALRIDFERLGHDGYAEDHTNGRPIDDANAYSTRATLKLDPTEDLDIVLRGNWTDARSGGPILNLGAVKPVFGPGGIPTFSPALLNTGLEIGSISFSDLLPLLEPSVFGAPTPAEFGRVIAGQEVAYRALTKYLNQNYNVNYDGLQSSRTKNDGTSLDATYRINEDLSVRSITSYQYSALDASTDVDATPFSLLQGPSDSQSDDQFTQELQLLGTGLDDKLKYTAGFYYYYLTGSENAPGTIELPFLNVTGSPVNSRTHIDDESYAFFGQGTYAFTPRIHVTGGVRWTEETNNLIATSTFGPTNACNVPPPAGVGGEPCRAAFSNPSHNFSYLASIDWEATDNVLLYAKTSRGFRAGGENQRGSVTGGFGPFAPEVVTDYEIGEKSDLLDHQVRLNVAAYHSDYSQIQRNVDTVLNGQTISLIQNAASATIDGVETELTVRPTPPLTLTANAAYTFPQYQSYFSGVGASRVNLTGDPFPDQPKWQLNLGAAYVYGLALANTPATLTGSVNFYYQTKASLNPDQLSIFSNEYTIQSPYGVLNARLALDIPKYAVTVEGWAKNLTDRRYLVGATDVTNQLGIGNALISDPRTFGFSVTKRF